MPYRDSIGVTGDRNYASKTNTMKNNSKGNEVIELETEDIGLEKTIENVLIKQNITDQVIGGLKEKFGSLALKDLSDREGYIEIKEARKEVRQWGILAEKICKTGREDAIKIQKLWLSKEKEVLGKIAEVQNPLDVEIKKFEDEQERIEQNKIRKQEDQNIQRQSTLSKLGAVYQDGNFILNHISYEAVLIKDADNDIWEATILPKYKAEYEKNEALRVAEEKKREEESEILKKEREELDRQQRELKEAQDALRLQQEQAQNVIRQEEERRVTEERKRRNDLQMTRLNLLLPVNPYGADVDMATLWTLEEDKFNEILKIKTEEFEVKKKRDEEDKLERIEKEKQEAIELAKKEERDRQQREQEAEKVRKEAEEFKRQQELSEASDKEKWDYLILQIAAIELPDMKSGAYRKAVQYVNKYFTELNSYFK